MILRLSGSVHFANGDPVPNVTVRIFDQDIPGKQDDDITITPGLSDEYGYFSLTYEPTRYLDYHLIHSSVIPNPSGEAQSNEDGLHLPDLGDTYLPYLRFDYTCNGLARTSTASMGVLQTRFYLPENPPVEFLPSIHGFRFVNSFPGYFLPISPPAIMSTRKVAAKYGLCGGMCAAAYDFALANRSVPSFSEVPRQGTRLQRYLFRRQIDSFGGLGQQMIKVAQWTMLPAETTVGTMRRTADEFSQFRQKLDQKNLVILALIFEHATSMGELSKGIFNNHQVLAYSYHQTADECFEISVYDPNLPGNDHVMIRAEAVEVAEENPASGLPMVMGLQSTEVVDGAEYRPIRGFFAMPYTPVKPPKGI